MPRRNFKDRAAAAGLPTSDRKPARRPAASSDNASGSSNLIEFRVPVNGDSPEPPEPAPNSSCSRPTMYRLDAQRDKILAAARGGRSYRSIAAQYGINALEVWHIVIAALPGRSALDTGNKAA